jgi:hypothetical protein
MTSCAGATVMINVSLSLINIGETASPTTMYKAAACSNRSCRPEGMMLSTKAVQRPSKYWARQISKNMFIVSAVLEVK